MRLFGRGGLGVLAVAGALGLLGSLAVAGPASAGPNTVAFQQRQWYGETYGTSDYDATKDVGWVDGAVKDLVADGHCVYAQVTFASGDVLTSPRACPKGEKKSYHLEGRGKVTLVKLGKIQA